MGSKFKPLNAPSTEAGLAAVAKFGRFFMGELWDTYVKKKGPSMAYDVVVIGSGFGGAITACRLERDGKGIDPGAWSALGQDQLSSKARRRLVVGCGLS